MPRRARAAQGSRRPDRDPRAGFPDKGYPRQPGRGWEAILDFHDRNLLEGYRRLPFEPGKRASRCRCPGLSTKSREPSESRASRG